MRAYLALAALLIWGASSFWAYSEGQQDAKDEIEAAEARDRRVATAARDAAIKASAEAISKIEVKSATIYQTMQREVVEKPVFRDCRSGPDIVRAFNSGIPGAAPEAPAGDDKLPAKDSTAR